MPNMINNNIEGLNTFLVKINEIMLFNQNLNTENNSSSQFWWINSWFYTYNSLISLTFMITIIFLVGLFLPKTPRGVSTLNVLSAFSIILFLFFLPVPHYNIVKHLVWFDYNLYVYLYIIIGGIFTAGFLAINNEITFLKENKHIEYPLLILLVFLFGIVVVASENFIAIFLALEAITLISAVLIGFQRTNNFSTLAGIRYILFSAVPGGALLLGISELYAYTGAFNFADIEKLLMNYNETFVDEATLNEVGQTLYNALDMVLYYNWDSQFNYYKDSLINIDEFLKHINNDNFNTVIFNSKNYPVLEQLINYEFENSAKENLEPITLSLLGSYIIQDNTNYDNNIKIGKYYIYKYISMNNYNNYSINFLKNNVEINEYLNTYINNIPKDYSNVSFTISENVDVNELRKDKNYQEFPCNPNISFFINFDDSVYKNVAVKKIVSNILYTMESKSNYLEYLNNTNYETHKNLIKQINPIFYNEILNSIELENNKNIWNFYESQVLDLISKNASKTSIDDKTFITNFLLEQKELLQNKINFIENNLELNSIKDFKFTTFEEFQKNNVKSFKLNNYFYSMLIEKLNLINYLIEKLENGGKIDIYFLDFLSTNENNRSLYLDLVNKLNDVKVENISSFEQFNTYLENKPNVLDNNINSFKSTLNTEYNIDFDELKNSKSNIAKEILDQSHFYYHIIGVALQKMYPFFIENKEYYFKVTISNNNNESALTILNDLKSEISLYLFNKDMSIKKDILNLVSVNHNYNLPTIVNISVFLIIFYILFKLTAAPFHIWAPSIYEGAPLPVTIFLSIFSKITMIFLLIKLLVFYLYFLYTEWSTILLFSGILSIIVGIYGAISETRIKRFFVYSSMGHVGFMLLGIAEGGVHGVLATVIYLMIYTVTVFIGWTILFASKQKVTHINQLSGLSKTNPTLSFILAISMLSMSGIPPLAGFYVKFEILYALVESEYYNIALLALLLTVFSFFYYLRIIKILYFEPVKKFKLQFNLNKTQAFLLSVCFLFLVNFSLYFQQPIIYNIKNIIIQSIY